MNVGFIITILLITMLFFHIADDYYLQGILATFKQKEWWEKNCPNKLYKHDYIIALIEHSFSWSFAIHIPLLIYAMNFNEYTFPFWVVIISVAINTTCHALIDNAKANRKTINLLVDQILHFLQILVTWWTYSCLILININ